MTAFKKLEQPHTVMGSFLTAVLKREVLVPSDMTGSRTTFIRASGSFNFQLPSYDFGEMISGIIDAPEHKKIAAIQAKLKSGVKCWIDPPYKDCFLIFRYGGTAVPCGDGEELPGFAYDTVAHLQQHNGAAMATCYVMPKEGPPTWLQQPFRLHFGVGSGDSFDNSNPNVQLMSCIPMAEIVASAMVRTGLRAYLSIVVGCGLLSLSRDEKLETTTQQAAVAKSLLVSKGRKTPPAITVVYVPRVHYERVVRVVTGSSGLTRSPHDRRSHMRQIFNKDRTVKKIVPVKSFKVHGGATEPQQHVVRKTKGVRITVLGLEKAEPWASLVMSGFGSVTA